LRNVNLLFLFLAVGTAAAIRMERNSLFIVKSEAEQQMALSKLLENVVQKSCCVK
jgi:hypothetical protein